jgi:glycine oxidase
VAAGMLAPFAEVGFEEIDLMRLGQESLRRYPEFLSQLKEDADDVPVFDQCGTLLAGIDRDVVRDTFVGAPVGESPR